MTTQQTQIARPTAATLAASTPQVNPVQPLAQSKPAFVPAAPKPANNSKPAAKAATKKTAPKAKPAAKKAVAAKPAPKAKASAKPAAKASATTSTKQPTFSFAKPAFKASPAAGAAAAEAITNLNQKASANFNLAITEGKQTIQAVIECGNQAANISKSIQAELQKLTTQAIAENSQAVKKLLACRTASDWMNLAGDLFRSHVDSSYATSLKLAELSSKFTKVAEPLNARLASASQVITKQLQK